MCNLTEQSVRLASICTLKSDLCDYESADKLKSSLTRLMCQFLAENVDILQVHHHHHKKEKKCTVVSGIGGRCARVDKNSAPCSASN